jgi:hypothetical protein
MSWNRYVLLLFVAPGAARAEEEPPTHATPAKVQVGVYVNQIERMSLKDNQFTANFDVWFRWKGNEVKPPATFEVVDGHIEVDDDAPYETELADGHYSSRRIIATVTHFWNISRFPLDNHTIRIAIEDSDLEDFKLTYVADAENCGISPELQVPGWQVGTPTAAVEQHQYHTNYGDTSLPTGNTSSYSRFVYSIPLARPNWGYFLKLFFGLFVATAIAFLALFIRPIDLDPRFGLGVGAIFASVASEYVVTSSLPDTSVLTLADVLHILAFVFIFLTLAESTLSLKLYNGGDEAGKEKSRRLDRWSFFVLLCAYAGLSGAAVAWY